MNNVSCGISQNFSFASVFSVSVDLTEKGEKNIKEVANYVNFFIGKCLRDLEKQENKEKFRKIVFFKKFSKI